MPEGVYAYRAAKQAGHRDTALLWFAQTFFIEFPSFELVNRLNEECSGLWVPHTGSTGLGERVATGVSYRGVFLVHDEGYF